MSRAFRLAGLLRLRSLAEEQAAAQLADRTRTRDAAAARSRATEQALSGAAFPTTMDATAMRAVVASRMALSSLLVDHRARVEVAQDAVTTAEGEWADARTRTRTLEKLQDKHETAVRAEEQRAEQVVLDEIAGRLGGRTPVTVGAGEPEDVR
ncbi:flagellar export protein FliJ [Cellulomonas triticagri]|uniref:Flagellar FliJ protein n=1 Tax=Cellulomonas triticagri TaxID=2483352 RepID=A0A3M2IP72_9CELL|nr:flagellar export protein FliJ [Cellulomonas triticagri]RMI02084.1 flagellar export protein FliJ [Cellulomonas triticagri]